MTERASRPRYASAAEAAAMLGVSRSSLYSYVSRGRIRAEPDPRDPRASRYLTADVERLRRRTAARLDPETAARNTLDWGLPLLESRLTLIDRGRFFYRGHDAIGLAGKASFEDVVRLLWVANPELDLRTPSPSARCREALARLSRVSPIERLRAILPLAESDAGRRDESTAGQHESGRRILGILAAAATGRHAGRSPSIAAALARGWQLRHAAEVRLLDRALILCADHELNVSTFAVRVVASARASLHAAVGAGLGALCGSRHGGYTESIECLLDEARSPGALAGTLSARIRRGESIPGFGHPLYPDGDPRAVALFSAIEAYSPDSHAVEFVRATRVAADSVVGDRPTIDYGLVLLRRVLALPRGSALVLFAIGRTAGWIAHALEQYADDRLIRPRAAYIGPAARD